MSRIYGFYDQCKKKAHIKVWKVYIEAEPTGRSVRVGRASPRNSCAMAIGF